VAETRRFFAELTKRQQVPQKPRGPALQKNAN